MLIVFTLGEAVTVGLTSIWFAAGSIPALVCALLGGPLWLQITLFIAVSALCMLAFRPIASKYINSKVEPISADRILGIIGDLELDESLTSRDHVRQRQKHL